MVETSVAIDELVYGNVVFVVVSTYMFDSGQPWHVPMGSSLSDGVKLSARSRVNPTATSTDCMYRSCSRTIKPVSISVAFPRICLNISTDWLPVTCPLAIFQSAGDDELSDWNEVTSKTHTVGVELVVLSATRPDNGNHAHCKRDSTNAVVDITIGRTHSHWRDAEDGLDSLASPSKLSNDLLIREGGEVWMRPGMDTDLMSLDVFITEGIREFNHTRPDDEESGQQILRVEVIEEFRGIQPRAIVEAHSPSKLIGA